MTIEIRDTDSSSGPRADVRLGERSVTVSAKGGGYFDGPRELYETEKIVLDTKHGAISLVVVCDVTTAEPHIGVRVMAGVKNEGTLNRASRPLTFGNREVSIDWRATIETKGRPIGIGPFAWAMTAAKFWRAHPDIADQASQTFRASIVSLFEANPGFLPQILAASNALSANAAVDKVAKARKLLEELQAVESRRLGQAVSACRTIAGEVSSASLGERLAENGVTLCNTFFDPSEAPAPEPAGPVR